jgi:hypothetical protein
LSDGVQERLQNVFRINGEVVIRSVAGETLVVPIRGALVEMESVFVLNGVGAFIMKQMDGRTTLGEICDRVVEAFDVGRTDAERDVLDFVDQLAGGGLIVAVP